MKRFLLLFGAALACILFAGICIASVHDLLLPDSGVGFSTSNFIEGQAVRLYATVNSNSTKDLRGIVRFFQDNEQIEGDQPISVLSGKTDAVFADWIPSAGAHTIKVLIVPFNNPDDDPGNNSFTKEVYVLPDTDRDGIPNADDADDDNDSMPDTQDAFPLNRNESADSDGDNIGNNADTDDDNDGTPDAEDALPLNANETLDTDSDGIGNNEDSDDDGDGIPDLVEISGGTNPVKNDSDEDGVSDSEDIKPLDPAQTRDYDKDGISDERDEDADNDGVLKKQDVNDTNLGPTIIVTTDGKPLRRLAFTNSAVAYDVSNSKDPDGEIESAEWLLENENSEGMQIKKTFSKAEFFPITVKLTDDKGEISEKTFTVLVMPPFAPWLLLIIAAILAALAIYKVFTYSKRRR